MKYFSDYLDEQGIYTSDDFYSYVSQYVDDIKDAVLVYIPELDEIAIETLMPMLPQHNPLDYVQGVVLHRFKQPKVEDFSIEDLFFPQEIEKIKKNYGGNWRKYLEDNPDYPLQDRIDGTYMEQFRQSWNTFVKIIDDKLEKIQGGA